MDPYSSSPAVTIIGGGMVGTACGLALQERGLSVTIIDAGDERDKASFGNAGVISNGSIFPMASAGIWKHLPRYALNRDNGLRIRYGNLPFLTPWLLRFMANANTTRREQTVAALAPFTATALSYHQKWAQRTSSEHLIRQEGWLRLYRSAEGFAGSEADRLLFERHGVKFDVLDTHALRELEPAIQHPFHRAIWLTETATVATPGELLLAYQQLFQQQGGRWVNDQIQQLHTAEGYVQLYGKQQHYKSQTVVLAAGALSAHLCQQLGYRIPLVAERGYHVSLPMPEGPALRRAVYDVAAGYVAAPMQDQLRLLSGVELAHPQSRANPIQLERLYPAAREALGLAPSMDTSQLWSGNRPSTPDSLPVLGFAPRHQHVLCAFGHGHIGFSTGPITGELIARLICREHLPVDIHPFRVDRF
ncbi:NAD(P)/FAD-dependent oxidoreductase [Paenalcaligenes sp. Me131]|uniref:NAD(P)/FAD-dependent oxidoreductase n=1 Tax=Paenalcaligenes sp. Me131 TaxID=3392636 RepID=UPI003D2BB2EE